MILIEDFLSHLRDLNIKLQVHGNALRLSAPENTVTDELRAQLRERKTEIIAFLQSNRPDAPEAEEVIPKVPRENNEFPLSFAQQRLWILDQLEGENASYNMPLALQMDGPLHQQALEQSLLAMLNRHEILRTTFNVVNGNPLQEVHPITEYQLPITDLKLLSQEQQTVEVQRLIKEEFQASFDLSAGPLIRMRLLQLTTEAHILVINMHHIISDGWSTDVFVREWSQLYDAFHQGKSSPLSPLPIQYRDFAHWQRKWLTGDVLAKQLNYWKHKLSDAPALLELPIDYPRPPVQSFSGSSLSVMLPMELTTQLKDLSRQMGTTLFMTLWSAFAVLLSRYNGQTDIVIGSPIANRTNKITETLIGFFVNTLVLRLDLANNPTFRSLLEQARQVSLEAYNHQDIPFEQLVGELNPSRNLSYSPLFQVMLVFQNTPASTLKLRDLAVSLLDFENQTTKFDLNFHLAETEQGLLGTLQYNTDLFAESTIQRMLGHFQTLLENIVSTPDKRLSALRILNDSEQHDLSTRANLVHSTTPFIEFQSQEKTLVERFEKQVQQSPQQIAVKTPNDQWTYQELNEKANQVARALLLTGPEKERVALLFEQGISMIASLVGALKAGKTYIPLDVEYPHERLATVLQDSQANLLLTNKNNEGLAQTIMGIPSSVELINFDDLKSIASGDYPRPLLSGDSIAYLLYTSGSTGKPKGVVQTHRNVLHFIRHYTNNLHITAEDRLTLLSSYSFDAAVVDIFTALLNGATLYPIDLKNQDIATLSHWLTEEQITVYHSVPTVFQHFMLTLSENAAFPHLRLVVFGGEKAEARIIANYQSIFSDDCLFVNLFGSTESTISLLYLWNQQTEHSRNVFPIGYPIAETEVLLLDNNGEATEICGEIAIRSAYLALGYWQQEQLSQSVFLADPDGGTRRIYRTGDRGRLLSDGSIEFIERQDFQVKIRGFRVELGEIEMVLTTHESVQESVVIAHKSLKGDDGLLAYLVPHQAHIINEDELREFVKTKVPSYMIPQAFVALKTMPRTASGKINRRALQTKSADYQFSSEAFVAPRTPNEEILADIWIDVLDIKSIGVHDNFFALGGHSLLATQVMSRIRASFDVELPLRELFDSPTIAGLDKKILQAHQRPALPAITQLDRSQPLPLSFAQQRLWFLDQLEDSQAIYNMQAALRLEGVLHRKALIESFQTIWLRHENLRSTFTTHNGSPVVQVLEAPFEVAISDLSSLSREDQEKKVQQMVNDDAHHPFDLEKGPLFRTTLCLLGPQSHVLILNIHHIISDEWSIGVLVKEWSALYDAFSRETPSPLQELPIQYADFAQWQRQWLTGDLLDQQMDYWRQQLSGIPSVLELPTDYPRPRLQRFQGASFPMVVNDQLAKQLRALSQQTGVTLFMTLWSAFAILLSRYSGQNDIVMGSPIANRTHLQTESLIGFFVNTLILRLQLDDHPTFKELLLKARQVALGAYTHQDIPFERLVEELQPERNLGHTPFFQVMFVLQNAPVSELELPELTIAPFERERGIAKIDLTLSLTETSSGLQGTLEYNADLFDRTSIERMSGHFQTLLQGIVEDPLQKIHELPLLTVAEQQQMAAWNATTTDYPQEVCTHHLFEAQAKERPDALALVFEDREGNRQQLSYRELNTQANQLAKHLQTMGVKPEMRVGVYMERSLSTIVCLLGIFKAGGVYLPLDPDYPPKRLAFMLEDASVQVLLTKSNFMEHLRDTSATVICLDREADFLANLTAENPSSAVEPQNVAYVVYTSGSTGKPKGVLVTHQGLCNLTCAQMQIFDVQPESNVLQFVSLNFDVSISDIAMALCAGATLNLGAHDLIASTDKLIRILEDHAITHVEIPPSVLKTLPVERLPQLQGIIVGGEASPLEVAAQWSKGRRFFNAYGPTETTVCATVFENTAETPSILPIGRPIANVQIHILDSYLQPVPINIPGELYIGGAGVARGYLNREDLTAEKFIQNPFSDDPHSRLYKTGDLVLYLPDGNVKFLGRIDNQVKVRGFRIELGEIEAVLSTHPTVQENAVIVHESSSTDKRLVAFLIPYPGKPIETRELRVFLKEQLPDYMVPSLFVSIETIPRTPNGNKVDHQALLAQLEDFEPVAQENFVAPRDPTEELIAGIWADLLGIQKIGVFDNFFELGGHSLLATQVMSRLRDTFAVELPLRELFEFPTIAGLNQRVQASHQQSTLPPIAPVDRSTPLPLSFAQKRLWFLNKLEGSSATYNMPAALHLEGELNPRALEQSVSALVLRHETLRTAFPMLDGSPVVKLSKAIPLLQVIDLSELPLSERDIEVQRLIDEDAQKPFDLENGPLFRASLLQLETQFHVLLLNMHHIISDAWSMGIVIRELKVMYEAFLHDQPSPLQPLPIQYADFAHWQRQWLAGDVLEQQTNYWKQQLSGIPALHELPTDHPRPAVQRFQGDKLPLALTQELTEQLKQLSEQKGATLFMTLLTAFATLLSRYSGQNDIVIGSPIANRSHSQTESLIGFFINTLVFRLNLADNPSFEDALVQTRRVALDAYSHQDIPFEQLVEELQPTRSLSHSPLFQVMFILQNAPMSDLELSGLRLTPLKQKRVVAQFDLTLSLEETESGLTGTLEYNTDLFERATIERLSEHWQTLLAGIVENPLKPIHALPVLIPAEQQFFLTLNDTVGDTPQSLGFHQLFENQVEKKPQAIALEFEDTDGQRQQLTYRELNNQANQLAHYLQTIGVKPEVLVGICIERSPLMLVGLLGVLKAGGAYLPLDPTFPSARLAFILEDAQASVLLTHSDLLNTLPKVQSQIVCLDEAPSLQFPSENCVSDVRLENLAYVIYTSGSTGNPKGVQVGHASLLNFLVSMRQQPGLTESDALLAVTTLSFDIAALELYLPLIVGAKVVVANREMVADGEKLLEKLNSGEITVMQATPATWHLLIEAGWKNASPLKILCGGEALPHELAMQLLERGQSLWNLYGPTETTIWSMVSQIQAKSAPSGPISLGHPIANTCIHILDEHLQPVPMNVSGELHIGGAGLARGYKGRDDLTNQKFIKAPFDKDPHARLYKTGDLARYLPDGTIEYLGRMDNQVKIRGFRIELGEIEAILSTHPRVQESVVVVHEPNSGDKRLVAYLIQNPEQTIESGELRTFLKEQLPNYMVPTDYVTLETLPLTLNKKVDRRALSLLSINREVLEKQFVKPRDVVELQLVQIWEKVLNVHPIGIQDNFFELGGHSLLAVSLMAQIEQQFEQRLALVTLFQGPTIEQLAPFLRQQTAPQSGRSLVTIQPNGSKPPIFCVPGAGGNVFYLYELARHLGTDQPFYGLQALGLDGDSRPHETVEAMAADYLKEIQAVQPTGPYLLGGHSFGSKVALEMSRQLSQRGETSRLFIFDTCAPFLINQPINEMELDDRHLIKEVADVIEEAVGRDLQITHDGLATLEPEEQWNLFEERLKMINFLPSGDNQKQLRGFVEVFKISKQDRYVPKSAFQLPYLALFKTDLTQTKFQETFSNVSDDPTWGWHEYSETVTTHFVAGNHNTMLTTPHAQGFAKQLNRCLADALKKGFAN